MHIKSGSKIIKALTKRIIARDEDECRVSSNVMMTRSVIMKQ